MKNILKKGMSGLMAVLVCLTTFIGIGATPAFAASETAESYMVSYPVSYTHLTLPTKA